MINVAMVNRCSVLTDHQASITLPAFQLQYDRDVCPMWGLDSVHLSYVPRHLPIPKGQGIWPIYLQDNSDAPGALGYHEDTGNVPDGRVFARTTMRYHQSWTVDFTHEFIEMMVDPTTDRWAPLPGMPGWSVIVEPGDPVEADELGYTIPLASGAKVLVSDFALPSYYGLPNQATPKAAGTFDFMGKLAKACPALDAGGYVSLRDPNGEIQQLTARLADGSMSHRSVRVSRVYRRDM